MAASQDVYQNPCKKKISNPLLLLFTVGLLSAAFKPQLCDFLLFCFYCDKSVIDSFQ